MIKKIFKTKKKQNSGLLFLRENTPLSTMANCIDNHSLFATHNK